MRVGLLTAGFLLTSAIVSHAAIVNMSPPPPSKTQAPLPPLPPVPLPPQTPAPAPARAPAPTHAPATAKAPVPAAPSAPVTAKVPAPAPVTASVPTPRPVTAKASAPDTAPVAASVPTPRPARVLAKAQAKVACPCDCPKDHAVSQHVQAHAVPRRMARRYADNGYYRYSAAAPVTRQEWHGQWRVAPNDAVIPGPASGPMAYGPPPPYGYDPQGLQVDDRGWTGGVGAASDGGGGGGFVDGYGQVHFANGGSVENGPSYNSYGQSFQYNPSQPGPFQPRLMGGFAPPSSGSR